MFKQAETGTEHDCLLMIVHVGCLPEDCYLIYRNHTTDSSDWHDICAFSFAFAFHHLFLRVPFLQLNVTQANSAKQTVGGEIRTSHLIIMMESGVDGTDTLTTRPHIRQETEVMVNENPEGNRPMGVGRLIDNGRMKLAQEHYQHPHPVQSNERLMIQKQHKSHLTPKKDIELLKRKELMSSVRRSELNET